MRHAVVLADRPAWRKDERAPAHHEVMAEERRGYHLVIPAGRRDVSRPRPLSGRR
jgi:hypothetical protein